MLDDEWHHPAGLRYQAYFVTATLRRLGRLEHDFSSASVLGF